MARQSARSLCQLSSQLGRRQRQLLSSSSMRSLSVLSPSSTGFADKTYTRDVSSQSCLPLSFPVTVSKRQFSSPPPPGGGGGGGAGMQLPPWMTEQQAKPGEYLELYTTNLTQMAADGKLDPIIGRHEEIRRCLQILARRTKNSK